MKKLIVTTVSIACLALLFTTCKKNEDDKVDNNDAGGLTISNTQETSQTAFADEETTGGFTFTAKSDWTANIKETKGNSVSWLKLLYNGEEKYSGGAGTFKMEISIDENYTGQTRSASIEIVSGSDKITVTVTQNGTTQSGEIPKGFEIDLSGKIAGKGIATLKVVMSGECEIVYTFSAGETGGKIILPNTIKYCLVNATEWKWIYNVSNSNAKIAVSDDAIVEALNSAGETIGWFSFEGPDSKYYWASLIYLDQDCSGIFEGDNVSSFKKGWNILYTHQYDPTKEMRNTYSEKPAGIDYNWGYHSISEKKK